MNRLKHIFAPPLLSADFLSKLSLRDTAYVALFFFSTAPSATWFDFPDSKGMFFLSFCILLNIITMNLMACQDFLFIFHFLAFTYQIQLLADLDVKKTPQLLELVEEEKVARITHIHKLL